MKLSSFQAIRFTGSKTFYLNMIESLKNYLIGSYAEMKKVTWPTKNQTINYSLLVIGLSIFMAVFFAVIDYAFSIGITKIIAG